MKMIIESGGQEGSTNPGDTFGSLQLGLKLVPNMDQHNFLLKRMSLVGGEDTGYSGLEDSVEYDMAGIGDASAVPRFFEWNGASHTNFPIFKYDDDHVPLGDSVDFCLGISWTTLKKKSQYDKYLDVRGFPACKEYTTGRS